MKALITLVFCIVVYLLPGQTDKERFAKTFDEEMDYADNLQRQNHSARYATTKPQLVPNWFNNIPAGNDSLIYAVGISDPGMDSATAMAMAIDRARVVASLMRKSNVQLICDFFYDEATHTNQVMYEHYSRIYTYMPLSAELLRVVNSTINQFGEALVLIEYRPPQAVNPDNLQLVQCDLYKNETEKSIYGNYESVYELLVEPNKLQSQKPMLYQLTEYGPRYDVGSSFDSLHSTIPIYTLTYQNISGTDSLPYRTFSHGLWKEFYKELVTTIVAVARQKPENISQLASKHNTSSYQKLTRGMSENKMRFTISRIMGSENSLNVVLTELPVQK